MQLKKLYCRRVQSRLPRYVRGQSSALILVLSGLSDLSLRDMLLCFGIVMLSGIGDASQLSSLGIQTLVDIPGVGRKLVVSLFPKFPFSLYSSYTRLVQDHPLLGSSWTVSSNDTLDNLQLNAEFFNEQLSLWETDHTGELILSGANQKGFLRLRDDDPAFGNETIEDPSAGSTSGHYEFIFSVSDLYGKSATRDLMTTIGCIRSIGRAEICEWDTPGWPFLFHGHKRRFTIVRLVAYRPDWLFIADSIHLLCHTVQSAI